MDSLPAINEILSQLLVQCRARAIGLWRVEADHLLQVAFIPALDMPAEVARGFREKTQRVPLSQSDLGIVKAAASTVAVVSRAAELSPEGGSGYWLRAFGATRSLAVPLVAPDQRTVQAVLSVAAIGPPPEDEAIVTWIREAGSRLMADRSRTS